MMSISSINESPLFAHQGRLFCVGLYTNRRSVGEGSVQSARMHRLVKAFVNQVPYIVLLAYRSLDKHYIW